jgi:hypothetical protein
MENRTLSSAHSLGHSWETQKPLSEAASRYPYPASLRSPDLRQTGQGSTSGALLRDDKNHASLSWSSNPDFAFLSLARFHREQDAWNSLHVTGLKPPAKAVSGQRQKKSSWSDDPHAKVSRDGYNNGTAEKDSPIIHSAYSDSGYASKCSGSTHSIISSSCLVESTSSPGVVSSHNCINDSNHLVYNPSSLLDTVGVHLQLGYPIKCSYSHCTWTGKCASDKKYVYLRTRKGSYRTLADKGHKET